MNLHFFEDSLGFYANKTAERIIEIDSDNNIIVNLYTDCKNKSKNIQYITYQSKEYQSLWNQNVERVFIHYYSPLMQHLLKSVDEKVIKIWCFWSADFYELSKFSGEIYNNFSKKIVYHKPNLKWRIYTYMIQLLKKVQGKEYYLYDDYIKSINNFDYFACLLQSDYENVQKVCKARMKHHKWAYLSIEQAIGNLTNREINIGSRIMINHSASPALNHFEIIKKLNEVQVVNKIWIPLSYGNVNYKNRLIHEISKFKLNIEIEHEFLGLEQYNSKLNDVGFAIFNSKIQQAIGNIIPLIWKGVKVFLREENSVYVDFKRLGFHVYDIQTINANSFFPLTNKQINDNRNLLNSILSDEKLNCYYKDILNCNKPNLKCVE